MRKVSKRHRCNDNSFSDNTIVVPTPPRKGNAEYVRVRAAALDVVFRNLSFGIWKTENEIGVDYKGKNETHEQIMERLQRLSVTTPTRWHKNRGQYSMPGFQVKHDH